MENKKITITKDEFGKVVAKVCLEFAKLMEDPQAMIVSAKIGADIMTELFDKETPIEEPTEEPIKEDTPKGKITLKKFFEMKECEVCIHCDTKEKAKKLCEAFHKLGKKWSNNSSYLKELEWNTYKTNTVYYNDSRFCSLGFAREHDHKIYEFEDVILED